MINEVIFSLEFVDSGVEVAGMLVSPREVELQCFRENDFGGGQWKIIIVNLDKLPTVSLLSKEIIITKEEAHLLLGVLKRVDKHSGKLYYKYLISAVIVYLLIKFLK